MGNLSHGALPPPAFAWQVGKTAAEIDLINDLANLANCEPARAAMFVDKLITFLTVKVGQHDEGATIG